jgi:hypothetical protein
MSKIRLNKLSFSANSLLAIMLITASSASYAAENDDQLATRIGMDHFREAIKRGSRAFKTRQQKATKTALPVCSLRRTLTLTRKMIC